MIDHLKEEIFAHAAKESPRECCGLVVVIKGRSRYWPCQNLAIGTEHFELSPEDYAAAEDAGEIVAVVHSHPFANCAPSEADRVACERSKLRWHIVGYPTNTWSEISPTGYKTPLVGRVFAHGVLDCYALVRDYYAETLSIELPDFPRRDGWWQKGSNGEPPQNLYLDNFEKAGFVRALREPQLHDVLLMQVQADVPNHAAIYLGNETILHHLHSRLSSRDAYGGYWAKHTTQVLEYAHG